MGGRKRAGFRVAALLLSGITLPVEPRADDGPTGAIDAALFTCAVTADCTDLAMSPHEALEFLEISRGRSCALPGAYAIPSYRTQLEYSCKEWIAAGWRSSKKVIDQIFAQ
jgi:hypothetical protein